MAKSTTSDRNYLPPAIPVEFYTRLGELRGNPSEQDIPDDLSLAEATLFYDANSAIVEIPLMDGFSPIRIVGIQSSKDPSQSNPWLLIRHSDPTARLALHLPYTDRNVVLPITGNDTIHAIRPSGSNTARIIWQRKGTDRKELLLVSIPQPTDDNTITIAGPSSLTEYASFPSSLKLEAVFQKHITGDNSFEPIGLFRNTDTSSEYQISLANLQTGNSLIPNGYTLFDGKPVSDGDLDQIFLLQDNQSRSLVLFSLSNGIVMSNTSPKKPLPVMTLPVFDSSGNGFIGLSNRNECPSIMQYNSKEIRDFPDYEGAMVPPTKLSNGDVATVLKTKTGKFQLLNITSGEKIGNPLTPPSIDKDIANIWLTPQGRIMLYDRSKGGRILFADQSGNFVEIFHAKFAGTRFHKIPSDVDGVSIIKAQVDGGELFQNITYYVHNETGKITYSHNGEEIPLFVRKTSKGAVLCLRKLSANSDFITGGVGTKGFKIMSLKEVDTQFKPALNNTHALYQDVREPVIGPSGNLFSLVVLPTGEFAVANLTKLTLGLPIYTDLGYGETNAELIDIKGLTFGSTGMPFAVVIGKDIDPHSSKPIEKAYAAAIGPHAIAAPSLNAKGSPPKWWFNIRNM